MGWPAARFRPGPLATADALGWRGCCGYGQRMRAVLIDIDGVLTVSWKPLPGAVAALHRLRAAGIPLALVTNTTSRTQASIASALAEAGFPVTAGDVLTAPVIAAAYLHDRYPDARCLLLSSGDIAEDLADLTLARGDDQMPADVVLIGGAGPEFSYQALN
jgi:HAD superfamily hydrolase (TIGR01450 family)